MLANLNIKNVVLIDQLLIFFKQGLCALTGETGAGKSILLDSLGLALGARADAGLVRSGAEQAVVTAEFDISAKHPVFKRLKDNDIESDGELILKRVLSAEGRSKSYVNDQPISVGLLKLIGNDLVEIHGQFDTQELLNPQHHLGLLDSYAVHPDKINAMSQSWKTWKASEKEFLSVQQKIAQAKQDEEFYRASLEDLDELNPIAGEEKTLADLRDRLMRREQILENLNIAEQGMSDIENKTISLWKALDKLGQEGAQAVEAMRRMDAEMQEVTATLSSIAADIEADENSLESVDERLFSLKAQARKHGCNIDDLADKRNEIASALDAIENQDQVLNQLALQNKKLKQEYVAHAQELSQARQKAAKKMAKLVMAELPPLKLDRARFEVQITQTPENLWGASGMDDVSFMVATNPGAAAGPLNKIASGGEMARFMLALKVVLAETGTAGALVFDEVDSGVGGATAAAVGERLARLAQDRQILVVTHSPQVAAVAKHHWILMKSGNEKVTTTIIPLSQKNERQEEIARMISGAQITPEARAAANKLLEASVA